MVFFAMKRARLEGEMASARNYWNLDDGFDFRNVNLNGQFTHVFTMSQELAPKRDKIYIIASFVPWKRIFAGRMRKLN
jgi:hypothetical protein